MKKQAANIKNFAYYGNISQIEEYLNEVQEINNWLQESEDTVEGFNSEEEAFGWEITSYPQRLELMNELKPYFQLYSSAVDFEKRRRFIFFYL